MFHVFEKCLTAGRVPGGCVCGVGVACCAAGSKHADAGQSLPFTLWCLPPAVPSRAGCWHGPWMWFERRLAVVKFLFCNPWHWGRAESSREWGVPGCWGILDGLHPPLCLMSQHHWLSGLSWHHRRSPGWGFRNQIACFQPHFQQLEAPDPAGNEEA